MEVDILVEGIHGTGTDAQIVTTKTRGQLIEKKDSYYLLYDEIFDWEEKPGSSKQADKPVIHNRMKWREQSIELVRSGAVSSRMVFELGKCCRTEYPTPIGSIMLNIDTKKITRPHPKSQGETLWEVEYYLHQDLTETEEKTEEKTAEPGKKLPEQPSELPPLSVLRIHLTLI